MNSIGYARERKPSITGGKASSSLQLSGPCNRPLSLSFWVYFVLVLLSSFFFGEKKQTVLRRSLRGKETDASQTSRGGSYGKRDTKVKRLALGKRKEKLFYLLPFETGCRAALEKAVR